MPHPSHPHETSPHEVRSGTCVECGGPFVARGRGLDDQQYCSPKCQRRAQNRRNYARRKARKRQK